MPILVPEQVPGRQVHYGILGARCHVWSSFPDRLGLKLMVDSSPKVGPRGLFHSCLSMCDAIHGDPPHEFVVKGLGEVEVPHPRRLKPAAPDNSWRVRQAKHT